jgi:hypothetical protein
MVEEKRDFDLLIRMTESVREISPLKDLETWWNDPRHVMLVDGENVGLCTYEYPGLYNAHWFMKDRGRKAIEVGKEMIRYMFEHKDAEVIRGMIRMDYKASRWAVRQVGLRSLGVIETPHKPFDHELFYTNKKEFLKGNDLNG